MSWVNGSYRSQGTRGFSSRAFSRSRIPASHRRGGGATIGPPFPLSRGPDNTALLQIAQSASKKENVPRYRLSVYRLRSHGGGFKRLRAVEEIVLTGD